MVMNPSTVARAYGELEHRGVMSSKTGSGTYVTDPRPRGRDVTKINLLTERMDNIISQGINLDMTDEQLRDLVFARLIPFGVRTNQRERHERFNRHNVSFDKCNKGGRYPWTTWIFRCPRDASMDYQGPTDRVRPRPSSFFSKCCGPPRAGRWSWGVIHKIWPRT